MCRPSFHIWLGDEITPLMLEGNMNLLLARAHKKLKDRLNLPDLDHPDMRIGYIPFAKLSDDINTNELTNHLLKCKRKSNNQWELFTNGR